MSGMFWLLVILDMFVYFIYIILYTVVSELSLWKVARFTEMTGCPSNVVSVAQMQCGIVGPKHIFVNRYGFGDV